MSAKLNLSGNIFEGFVYLFILSEALYLPHIQAIDELIKPSPLANRKRISYLYTHPLMSFWTN